MGSLGGTFIISVLIGILISYVAFQTYKNYTTPVSRTGPQGLLGNQGIIGFPAPSINLPGPLGPVGERGPRGLTGIRGGRGAVGAVGLQGFQGSQGVQGLQGQQGQQGNSFTGLQGPQGYQGNIGSQGFQGVQGIAQPGSQGSQGLNGPQGLQGFQGFQGLQGPIIADILENTLGFQGSQGFQGNSLRGFQGFQGPINQDFALVSWDFVGNEQSSNATTKFTNVTWNGINPIIVNITNYGYLPINYLRLNIVVPSDVIQNIFNYTGKTIFKLFVDGGPPLSSAATITYISIHYFTTSVATANEIFLTLDPTSLPAPNYPIVNPADTLTVGFNPFYVDTNNTAQVYGCHFEGVLTSSANGPRIFEFGTGTYNLYPNLAPSIIGMAGFLNFVIKSM